MKLLSSAFQICSLEVLGCVRLLLYIVIVAEEICAINVSPAQASAGVQSRLIRSTADLLIPGGEAVLQSRGVCTYPPFRPVAQVGYQGDLTPVGISDGNDEAWQASCAAQDHHLMHSWAEVSPHHDVVHFEREESDAHVTHVKLIPNPDLPTEDQKLHRLYRRKNYEGDKREFPPREEQVVPSIRPPQPFPPEYEIRCDDHISILPFRDHLTGRAQYPSESQYPEAGITVPQFCWRYCWCRGRMVFCSTAYRNSFPMLTQCENGCSCWPVERYPVLTRPDSVQGRPTRYGRGGRWSGGARRGDNTE
jgi:hypothetical protein